MRETGEAIQALQVGSVKTGWAWWNRLRAKQAIAATQLATAQTSYVQSLVARKQVEIDLVTMEERIKHVPRDLELEYRQKELLHAKAELEYNTAEVEYQFLERQARYKAAMLYALERVADQAAEYGRTLATHQEILKHEAITQGEIDKLWAGSDARRAEIETQTESELQLLDKKLEAGLAMLDAKSRHDIELFLTQAEAELTKMETEARLTIGRLEAETDNRIKEILTIEGARSQWRINEMNVESDNRVREAEALANIRIRENMLNEWVKTETRRIEIEQDLKAGFEFAQSEYRMLQIFKEYMFGLYEERERIQLDDGLAKKDKLKLLNGHIRTMEKDFRGKNQRLLQAATSADAEGSDQDSES
jgi:hypothetical protein